MRVSFLLFPSCLSGQGRVTLRNTDYYATLMLLDCCKCNNDMQFRPKLIILLNISLRLCDTLSVNAFMFDFCMLVCFLARVKTCFSLPVYYVPCVCEARYSKTTDWDEMPWLAVRSPTDHCMKRFENATHLAGSVSLARVHLTRRVLCWLCVHLTHHVHCWLCVHITRRVLCWLCVHLTRHVHCWLCVHLTRCVHCWLCVHLTRRAHCWLCVHLTRHVHCWLCVHLTRCIHCWLCVHLTRRVHGWLCLACWCTSHTPCTLLALCR